MLDAEEEARLKALCNEFRTLSTSLCKLLNVSNPPTDGQIALLLKAEADASLVLTNIKKTLRIADRAA